MTLREKVAEAMFEADQPYTWASQIDVKQEQYRTMSDTAIATVFGALLSDTAVEASEQALQESIDANSWPGESYDTAPDDVVAALTAARAALTADDAQTGGDND